MFDHVSDFGSIGYVEVDFAIQVDIAPYGRVGIDNDLEVLPSKPKIRLSQDRRPFTTMSPSMMLPSVRKISPLLVWTSSPTRVSLSLIFPFTVLTRSQNFSAGVSLNTAIHCRQRPVYGYI